MWQLACTGRQWAEFVSFDPRLPEKMRLFKRAREARREAHRRARGRGAVLPEGPRPDARDGAEVRVTVTVPVSTIEKPLTPIDFIAALDACSTHLEVGQFCDQVPARAFGRALHARRGGEAHRDQGTPAGQEARVKKLERAWMDAITQIGCIVCLFARAQARPSEPHHLLSGGRRRGHLDTICLCDPGHHQNSIERRRRSADTRDQCRDASKPPTGLKNLC
jgi:hypothetical protein